MKIIIIIIIIINIGIMNKKYLEILKKWKNEKS